MAQAENRQWRLARRPNGPITTADFRLSETEVPEPGEGEVLVRNVYLSCDPTQRGWMARDTYLPAIALGEVIRSFAAGEVVRSNHPSYRPGQHVQGLFGWQDYAVVKPGASAPISVIPDDVPISTGLSALGLTGRTAYFGLLDVGRPKAGETVVVSGAAGATGSMVGQIAKALGCRAIGIAGGKTKCDFLTGELGFDAAIDYKSDDVSAALGNLCPKGIDVFFDNVGGPILDAALGALAMHGRVVICGAISTYNEDGPPAGPKNYLNLLVRRGRMEGFLVLDYMDRVDEATAALRGWLREGKLKDRVSVVEGFENAPTALAQLFTGENVGKQLVKIGEE